MYQPQPGDRVTVTRRGTDKRIYRHTGIYRPAEYDVDAFWVGDRWYAGNATMHHHHPEAEQTLTPAPEEQP